MGRRGDGETGRRGDGETGRRGDGGLPGRPGAGRSTQADSTTNSNPEGEAAPDAARASSFGLTATAISRVLAGANDGDVATDGDMGVRGGG